jgi:hypothetical protein
MFGSETVSEFVQYFGSRQNKSQAKDIDRAEKGIKLRQLGVKRVELHEDQRQCRQTENKTGKKSERMKTPTDEGIQKRKHRIGIDSFELDSEDVGEFLREFFSPPFFASFEKFFSLMGSGSDNQSALVELSEEMLQFVEGNLLRRKFFFKGFFDFIKTMISIEKLEQDIFFFLEAKVPRTNGVFENPKILSERRLPFGGQVRSKLNRQLSGGTGCESVGHGMLTEPQSLGYKKWQWNVAKGQRVFQKNSTPFGILCAFSVCPARSKSSSGVKSCHRFSRHFV